MQWRNKGLKTATGLSLQAQAVATICYSAVGTPSTALLTGEPGRSSSHQVWSFWSNGLGLMDISIQAAWENARWILPQWLQLVQSLLLIITKIIIFTMGKIIFSHLSQWKVLQNERHLWIIFCINCILYFFNIKCCKIKLYFIMIRIDMWWN